MGGPTSGRTEQQHVEHRAALRRVVRHRGRAATKNCNDCGNPAQEWSLDPQSDAVLFSKYPDTYGRRYSLDVYAYEAVCCPCRYKRVSA